MAIGHLSLPAALDLVEGVYGPPAPAVTDPWEQVLLENVAYLADEERRLQALERLRARFGTSPDALLARSAGELSEVTAAGIRAGAQAGKLHAAARELLERFGGDLSGLASMPLPEARRALRRFPAIGEPGADRILLRAGLHAVPALDSNGLRVLVRLGMVTDTPGYAAAYRSAVTMVAGALPAERGPLLRASLLLATHGRRLCRRSAPACGACPLAQRCDHALRGRSRPGSASPAVLR